ncbi:hypothetical protein EDC04DRAFT_2905058 [Pisolithus marmoratus]|nr:hypothetical protein EDC04DRAFT_2905058 [Pisolithus marmoratus]
MPAHALPPANKLPHWIWQHPRSHEIESAYNICLHLERWIQREIDSGKESKETEKKMVHCRILGYLFHHFPARDIKSFVKEIRFYEYLVQLFKANKGPTPTPSSHPSRRSFDNLAEMIESMLQEAPRNHQTAKKHALARDGFRCAVTKLYDWNSVRVNELKIKVKREGAQPGTTQCAHIFPGSTNANITPGSDKTKYASSVWVVLDRFGYSSLQEELNGPNIHRLENVITMEPSLHHLFDSLQIWFTETAEPDKYKLEAVDDCLISRSPKYVTFSTPDPQRLPLPSPTYLAIHAACAKVAHLSGAAEYIEKILRRMEDTCVLAEDGGSAELLHTAITSSMRLVSV